MRQKRYKHPQIPHLPWSRGITNDDKVLKSTDCFIGKEVVISLKMDGENSSIYTDFVHARSIDSDYHISRSWIYKLQGEIGYLLNENERICGENVAAEHSIHYKNLKSFFYVFSYWIEDICQSWNDTLRRAKDLNLQVVPTLYRGIWNEKVIKELQKPTFCENEMEGYVVRLTSSFSLKDFSNSIAKEVRQNHVKTDEHWKNKKVLWNEWKKSI
jgi:hypothetical protein